MIGEMTKFAVIPHHSVFEGKKATGGTSPNLALLVSNGLAPLTTNQHTNRIVFRPVHIAATEMNEPLDNC